MNYLTRSIVVLSVLLVLFSCNNNQPSSAPITKAGPGTSSSPTAKKVRLLTWRYLPQDQQVVQDFATKTGIRVEVDVRSVAEIIQVAADGKSFGADVLIVPTLADAHKLRAYDALQPFFVDAFSSGEVGDKYLDLEGYWAGLTKWSMAAVYNPNAVTYEEVSTFQNLLQVTERGVRMGVAHPDSSGLAAVVSGLYQEISPEAAELFARLLVTNAEGGAQGSDYDQLNRMLAGELDMAYVSVGATIRWMLNGDPTHYKAAEFWRVRYPKTKNTGRSFMNLTCVTMLANAPHRAEADALINHLFQQATQEALSNAWFELPAQSFANGNDYIYGLPDRIDTHLGGEALEKHLPEAIRLLNTQTN